MINNTEDEPSEISKKKKILLAASKLFLKKDFKTVSTQEIAKEAGVAKGTVFHHYANKHLLALAVLDEFMSQMSSDMDKMKEEMEPEEIIVAVIRYSMDLSESSAGLIQLLIQVIADIDYLSKGHLTKGEELMHEKVLKIESLLAGYMEEFAGLFEKQGFEKPLAYSRIFIAMLDGLGLQLLLKPKPDKVLMEQLTTLMIELFTQR